MGDRQTRPYVYRGVNRNTQKVYIGYRAANKRAPVDDLGIYKTSSRIVRPMFAEFDWEVVAEFVDPAEAYTVEQALIAEQWQTAKHLSLNLHHRHGKKAWNSIGRTYEHLESTKKKIAEGREGWKHTEDVKARISRLKAGVQSTFKGHKHTEAANAANRSAHLGKTHSEESKLRMSVSRSGSGNHMFGKKQTEAAVEKQRQKALARKPKQCDYCEVSMKPGNLAQHIKRRHTFFVQE